MLNSSTDVVPLKCLRVPMRRCPSYHWRFKRRSWTKGQARESDQREVFEETRQAQGWGGGTSKGEDTEERKRGSEKGHDSKIGKALIIGHLLPESLLTLTYTISLLSPS